MKKICFLLCIVLMGVSMLGCSTNTQTPSVDSDSSVASEDSTETVEEDSTETVEKVSEEEEVTLSFVHWRSEDVEVYKEINALFEEQYPNIKIQMDVKSANQEEYYSVLRTKLSGSNDSIDVFLCHPGARLSEFVAARKVLDLSGQPVLDNYEPSALAAAVIDGKNYALTQAYNTYLIFYDKDVFEENNLTPPTSWAEMQETVKALDALGMDTIAAGFAEDWVYDMVFLPILAAYNPGNEQILRQIQDGEVKFSDENVRVVFEDIQAMGQEGFFQHGAPGTKYEASLALFTQKIAPMLLTGTWSIGGFKSQAPDLNQGYTLLPSSGQDNVMLFDPGHLICVNSGSKKIDAAIKYISFLSSPEISKIYCDKTGQLPAISGVESNSAELAEVAELFESTTTVNNPNQYLTNSKFIEIYTSTCAKAYLGEDLDTILAEAQAATDALE